MRYPGFSDVTVASLIEKAKPNKFNAKRVTIEGYVFDSKKEGTRYSALRLMQAAGLISSIQVHPEYPIYINDVKVCVVELDFAYTDLKTGEAVHEDVKSAGTDTPLSRLKRKMCEAYYGFEVRVIK